MDDDRKALTLAVGAVAAVAAVIGLAVVVQHDWLTTTTSTTPTTLFVPSSTCPHTTTTVRIILTVNAANDITGPTATPTICPKDDVLWAVQNNCTTCGNVTVEIDKQKRNRCDDGTATNFLEDKSASAKCAPSKTFPPSTQPVDMDETCRVKKVKNGCYKYGLAGTYSIDPEVEVQGGN